MMSPCHTSTTENPVTQSHVRALVWPLIALLGSCAWGGAARTKLEAPQPVAELPQPVAELSEERGAQACPERSEGSARVKFYLADQLGDSLRMRDHCDSSERVEPPEGEWSERCAERLSCGQALAHRWLPLELSAYLALMDLALLRAPLKLSSMRQAHQDSMTVSQAKLPQLKNKHLEVSHERRVQARVSRQELHFSLGDEGRCLYQLKLFADQVDDELVYQGFKELSARFESGGFSSTRYLFEQRELSREVEVLFLVDSGVETLDEGALLQQQLLCKWPRGHQSLLALKGLTLATRPQGPLSRVLQLTAPLNALTESAQRERLKERIYERAKGQARLD